MAKTIVITGAGSGLGKHLARRFAADGDQVVLLGRTLSKIEAIAASAGPNAMAVACDVGDADSVRAAFARIAERHPKIDVLINNAGVFEPSLLVEATDEHILKHLHTNLAGAMFCIRAAIPLMERGGHLVNVSSESVDMFYPHHLAYQASKGGLERMSRWLEEEVEPQGIRVTVVRAGRMYDEDMSYTPTPEQEAFHAACAARGMELRTLSISHYSSVVGLFRTLVDLPPDVHVPHMQVVSRRP
jgi:NAD(P)-dependent dehydrogenase (short-subunit alcohol dehydrogenase family)